MRLTSSTVAVLLPTSVLAVSLVDFTPRVSNLSSACEAIYTQPISGCTAADFTATRCSVICVKALEALEPSVQRACSSDGITGENILTAYLANSGPQSVCSNAKEVLEAGGGSPTPSSSSSAPAASTTILSGVETVSSLITSTVSNAAPSASSSAAGALSVDTSSVPSSVAIVTASAASMTSAPGSQQTGSSSDGGGGSPFDNMSSAASTSLPSILSMGLTVLVALSIGWR